MTTVVVAGSRALEPGIAPRLLIRFLAALPDDAEVLLRRGRTKAPGRFEAQVAATCELIGLKVEWCEPIEETAGTGPEWDPESTLAYVGRRQTFARDVEMISRADLVLCFWDAEETGDERSGTVSLASKAVEADKVVYAYAVAGEDVQRVGEHDPKNLWGERVPAPA